MESRWFSPVSLLLLLTFSASAWADGASLKIFGSGVANKKTGDSIALLCVGPESETPDPCSQMQFAYFENGVTATPRPIGPKYELAEPTGTSSDEAALSKATVSLVKVLQKNARKRGKTWLGLTAMVLTIGIGGAISIAVNAGLPAVLGVAVWVGCATRQCDPAIFDPFARVSNAFSGNVGLQEAILDQDGWNWASKPTRLSPKKFEKFYQLIGTGSTTSTVSLKAKR